MDHHEDGTVLWHISTLLSYCDCWNLCNIDIVSIAGISSGLQAIQLWQNWLVIRGFYRSEPEYCERLSAQIQEHRHFCLHATKIG